MTASRRKTAWAASGRAFLAMAAVTGLVVVIAGCAASAPTAQKSSAAATRPTAPTIGTVHARRTFSSDAVLLRYGDGSMWAVSSAGALAEISTTGAVTNTLGPSGVLDAQFAGNDLFALTSTGLSELDPSTRQTVAATAFASASAFATNGTVADFLSTSSQPTVTSVDLSTGASTTSAVLPNQFKDVGAGAIAIDSDGSTWLVDGDALIHLASPGLGVLASYPLTLHGDDLYLTSTAVFVATGDPGGGILRLTKGSSTIGKCWPGGDALQMVADGTSLWVSAAAGPTELDQATCKVLAQGPAPDDSGEGLAASPTEVWDVFPDSKKVEVLPASATN
jgi:hypothetical protein